MRWLTLAHLPGVGHVARRALFEHFGSIEAVFEAPGGLLERALPCSSEAIDAILAGDDGECHASTIEWLADEHHHLVTWQDEDYPALLREISDPPLLLYVICERTTLRAPQLAVVGSRNPTPGGRENAFAFARSLTAQGLVVTSGLALGVDGEAHRGTSGTEHPRLLDCLGFEPASIVQLVERSGLTADAVSSMLMELELRGQVTPSGGGRYVRLQSAPERANERKRF